MSDFLSSAVSCVCYKSALLAFNAAFKVLLLKKEMTG